MLRETLDLYQVIKQTYYIAKEEKDFNANAMLQDLLEDMNRVVAQMMLLDDEREQRPREYDKYDRHIGSWGMVGLEDYQ